MRFVVATLALLALLPSALAQSSDCATFTVSPMTLRPPSTGGSVSLFLQAPAGCVYEVTSDVGWAKPSVESVTARADGNTVAFTFEANPGADTRSGYVAIGPDAGEDVAVYVEQAGACSIRVARSVFAFPMEGGHGLIEVLTDGDDCGVAFASGYKWIQLDGVGGFDVLPNDGYDREGAVSVGQRGGSATVYVNVVQTGPLGPPGGVPATPSDVAADKTIDGSELPGPSVLLTLAAVALTLAWRRRG